jgi:hypothetical protein
VGAALLLGCRSASPEGAHRVGSRAELSSGYALLRTTLNPMEGETLSLALLPADSLFPNVRVIRGARVPAAASNEDARPRRAALLIWGADTLVVSELSHFGAAWQLIDSGSTFERDTLASVLRLLDLTGLVPHGEVLSRAGDIASELLRVPEAARQIQAPSISPIGDATVVTVFFRTTSRVAKLRFSLDARKAVSMQVTTVSPFVWSM